MQSRIDVSPVLLRWARERSGRTLGELTKRRLPVQAWEAKTTQPTMRQLEQFARATNTPVGYLFLSEPPSEIVPIPDFRTVGGKPVRPSPDLLDTIYACEQRQEWYRDFAEATQGDPVELVGSLNRHMPGVEAASRLRDRLGFSLDRRVDYANWTATLSGLSDHAELAGVLVMISGIVGSNTHRVLDPEEFRGFALADALAPLVFINGADTKAAQIFTLAHELAHITLGESAVSNPDLAELDDGDDAERWCNEVAAELLVPKASLQEAFSPERDLTAELDRLAKFYKVSTLVVLRRIADAKLIPQASYQAEFAEEFARVMALTPEKSSGGSFYNTTPVRVSKRFARALIIDTLEGRTSYRDAFRLLGSRKMSAFEGLGQNLGVA